MTPDHVLERIAATLRHDIGPAVGDSLPKTQAFMAAVILEKLAGELRLAQTHAQANAADREALVTDIQAQLEASLTPRLRAALDATARADAGLSEVVRALYDERDQLGPDRFDALLARVRLTLRARLDRQLEYAS